MRKGFGVSTILVVDDEERIRTLLSRSVTRAGHRVRTAADGNEAVAVLDDGGVDLVLLDLVMPGGDGFTVLEALRDRPDAPPVIVVSAVHEVSARVDALNRGAVDVVGKPFVLVELLARVNRHLGVALREAAEHRHLSVAGLTLDTHRRIAAMGSQVVALTEREVALLAHLMRRHGNVCTREELLHDVWGLDFDPGSNLVEVCVRRLRTKLSVPDFIETVRGVGYCVAGV